MPSTSTSRILPKPNPYWKSTEHSFLLLHPAMAVAAAEAELQLDAASHEAAACPPLALWPSASRPLSLLPHHPSFQCRTTNTMILPAPPMKRALPLTPILVLILLMTLVLLIWYLLQLVYCVVVLLFPLAALLPVVLEQNGAERLPTATRASVPNKHRPGSCHAN